MLALFVVATPITHELDNGDVVHFKFDMNASEFKSQYTLNVEDAYHELFKNGSGNRISRIGAKVISVNLTNQHFYKAIGGIEIKDLETFRMNALEMIKNRRFSPLNLDKVMLYNHGGKLDAKSKLLGGMHYTYIKGVGIFESDYIGNVLYGSVMANFQSLTSSLGDGDFLQSNGIDDVYDSHAIIVGHYEGKTKISTTTFSRVNKFTLVKETFVHGKFYHTYEILNKDTGEQFTRKTTN